MHAINKSFGEMTMEEIEELENNSTSLIGKSVANAERSADQDAQRFVVYVSELENPINLYAFNSIAGKSYLQTLQKAKKLTFIGKTEKYFFFRTGAKRWITPVEELADLFRQKGITLTLRQKLTIIHKYVSSKKSAAPRATAKRAVVSF